MNLSMTVMSMPAPGLTPPLRKRTDSSVYKTKSGSFWHLAAKRPQPDASYVKTLCGRRLGRWNLLPGQPSMAVDADAVCLGCRRKVGHQ